MLERLKRLNPELEFFRITDEEFKKYGKVLDINTDEFVEICGKIQKPESGSSYLLSVNELENAKGASKIKDALFGGCDAQIGLCHGYSSQMNALEFHNSAEINVAATPLVLLLGLRYEMEGNEYDSKKIKAFYLEKGEAALIFGTSLHFCPCQVSDNGFSCVVVLPKDTNDVLDFKTDDKLLFKKNKWILCHDENNTLIDRGVHPGIHGINYMVKY